MAATRPQVLSLIAAVATNGAIGRDNDLLWHDSRDQKHFRATTLGCPVIMGRRTWDSLPERFRPLPGRRNIVITRNTTWQAPGAEVAHSLDEALALVAEAPKAFVMGGGELYALALPLAWGSSVTRVVGAQAVSQAITARDRPVRVCRMGIRWVIGRPALPR